MLLAALGDIHGNYPALEAVLERIDAMGIHTILNTGDAVCGYPFPCEVWRTIQSRGIVSVQGEMDRLTGMFTRKRASLESRRTAQEIEHLAWTTQTLSSDVIESLRALPKHRVLTLEGLDICLCHGSPRQQTEGLGPGTSAQILDRCREFANAHIIVCGRTHEGWSRLYHETLFVNPGSVGAMQGGQGSASFAVIDTESKPWQVRFEQVRYDAAAVTEALATAGLGEIGI